MGDNGEATNSYGWRPRSELERGGGDHQTTRWLKRRTPNHLATTKATALARVHSNLRLLGTRACEKYDDTCAEHNAKRWKSKEESDDGDMDDADNDADPAV